MALEGRRPTTDVDGLVWRTSLVAMGVALGFWAWFQLTKLPFIQAVDPFAEDPCDAIGSIAVQAAVGLALLSLARAARARGRSVAPKRHRDDLRFVLRGDLLVGVGILATIATDVLAIAQVPRPMTERGTAALVLVGGLGGLAVGTAVALAVLALAWRRLDRAYLGLPARSTYRRRMLAEAALDVVRLAWMPLAWVGGHVEVVRRRSEPLAKRLVHQPLVRGGVRTVLRILGHPWWSLALVATGGGVALVATDLLREGLPGDPGIALAVVTIFVTIETAAVLGGFFVFGAYLGLRPPLRRRDASS